MATCFNQVLLIFKDLNGKYATTFWPTQDQSSAVPGGLSSLGAAAAALSDCGLVAVQYQTTHVIGASGTTGAYPTVMDRVMMLANIASSGAPARYELPGPKSSIFLADNVTLDLSNADVAAFIAQVQGNCGDALGNATGVFKRGRRSQARGGP